MTKVMITKGRWGAVHFLPVDLVQRMPGAYFIITSTALADGPHSRVIFA